MGTGWRGVLWTDDSVRRFFHILLLLYIVKQLLIAIIMPAFTGHDEVVHFQYIRTVATDFRIPVIPDLDYWRENRQDEGPKTGGDFLDADLYPWARYVLDWFSYSPDDPRYDAYVDNPIHAVTFPDFHTNNMRESWPNGWQYAANHPPLFYVLSAPLYLATDWMSLENQMTVLRLIAIPFGLLAVIGTWLIARTLFPRAGFIAITASAFVAFQPQLSYEASMINNDILVIGLGAMLLALLVRGMRFGFPRRLVIVIGAIFGLMLLSKGSALAFAGPIALMMIAGIGWRNWRLWIPKGALAAAIGFGMAAPWYIFLYRTYGNLSGLDQIATLQYWATYDQGLDRPSVWDLVWNKNFAVMRWNETWGEFGWRLMPLTDTMLWVIGVPCLVLLAGFLFYAIRLMARRHDSEAQVGSVRNPATWQRWAIAALFLTCVLGYAAVIQFGLRFVLTQARYFFPMIPAAAVLLMIGLHTIIPARGRVYAQVVVVAVMVALNIYIFSAYVVPYWYVRADSPLLS